MQKFNEEYYKFYSFHKTKYDWNDAHLRQVKHFNYLFKPKRVLDVSCATGLYLKAWRMVGVEAEGSDISEWAINNPIELGLKMQVADITKPLPYEDNSFDLIMCFDTLEHLDKEDLAKVMKEFRRIGSKYIIITTLFKGVEGHKESWEGDKTHKIWETKGWWIHTLDCDNYGYFIMPYEVVEGKEMWFMPLIDKMIVTGVENGKEKD